MVKRKLRWDWERRVWWHADAGRLGRLYIVSKCLQCGAEGTFYKGKGLCGDCIRPWYERQRVISGRAHAVVLKAKKAGSLPALTGSIACMDCGNPAEVYDHREYAKPLEVDPVCKSCNARRGPAIDALPWLRLIRVSGGV